MNSVPFELLLPAALFASTVMLLLWQRQRRTLDATPVDVGWAAILALLAIFYALCAPGLPARRVFVGGFAGLASGRLAWHLYVDRARSGVEDGRYAALRQRWGARSQRNFFWLFQVQALLDVVLSLPFLLACSSAAPWGALDVAALALGSIALAGEWIADRELGRFRAQAGNRGRTCRVGLWRFSRHPNYFFQWLLWCAYALAAASAPLGWLAVASPLVMLFLILRVSGIPPTEAQALRSRGDDYREYQRTTSAFLPWFPRASQP